jgi:SAM-dependent methyltransferase
MAEWFSNDEFWARFEEHLFTPARLEAARVEVDRLIALFDVQPAAAVLDLGCGPARHALEFARRGFKVTGVDRTRRYLDKARATAHAEGLAIEFIESDMREFVRPDSFDAALNFFTAFGYFDDAADDLRVARNLCTSLKPGGRLLIDVAGKEIIAARYQPRGWDRHGDTIVLEERHLFDGWKRLESKWTMIRGTERYESSVILRLYSGAELESLLHRAGFSRVELYGKLSGVPYDQNAERLIAVATK